jgi:hypothetical protein
VSEVVCAHCHRAYELSGISNCGFCTAFRGCLRCYREKHRSIHNEERGLEVIVKAPVGVIDFQPAPAGVHSARCCDVRDLGMVKSSWQGVEKEAHKILVSWMISELREDGKPFLVSKRYTASLHEKAALRKELAAWRGRDFTEAELDGFDLDSVIGVAALLNVVHAKSQDGMKTYANVASIMPLPKGMKAPDVSSDFVRFQDRPPKEGAPAGEPPPPDDSHAPPEDDDTSIPF